MKKLIFILGLFILSSAGMVAQTAGCNCSGESEYLEYLYNGLIGSEYRNPAEGYKGNQYYGPWEEGSIAFDNGQKLAGIPLRYDMYMHKLLWIRQKDFKTGILPVSDVVSFTVPDSRSGREVTFVRKRIRLPYQPDTTVLYLRRLADGDVSFLSCHQAIESPSEYELVNNTHYLVFSSNNYVYTGLRRRLLLKVPFIDADRMKTILKSNRIRIRNNEVQVARAFALYNQTLGTK